MTSTFALFISTFVRFFFLLTPFFIISVFLALTVDSNEMTKKLLAIKVTVGVEVITVILLLGGDVIFNLLGISVPAFKIGAGALLFLSAVSLVQGRPTVPDVKSSVLDLAIVPMAIPLTLGPGSVGALVVMCTDLSDFTQLFTSMIAVSLAVLSVGILLYLSPKIVDIIGDKGIQMLSKLTGLVLAALSAQMMFEGASTFF